MVAVQEPDRPPPGRERLQRSMDVGPLVASVLHTTEVRWFVGAGLPDRVANWFIAGGQRGLIEERTDHYLLPQGPDRGLKRRHGHTLEVKERLGDPTIIELAPGLSGTVERWCRRSPADLVIEETADNRWCSVHKFVMKRRFSPDGHERAITPANRSLYGEGCDVEIAEVRTDNAVAWTLAFAAYGNDEADIESMRAAAATVLVDDLQAPSLSFGSAVSSGYPQWLAFTQQLT